MLRLDWSALSEHAVFHLPAGFHVMPRRWVVERTLAWLGRNRRLAKDYDCLSETSGMLLYLAMSRILLRRLTTQWATLLLTSL